MKTNIYFLEEKNKLQQFKFGKANTKNTENFQKNFYFN